VQPISIAYTRLAGIPMGNHYRPYFSWFGAMDLAPHAKECLSFSSITVEVTIHPAIEGETLKDRKKLAGICEQMVTASMAESLTRPKPKKDKKKTTLLAA
jgi:1-acyl-sn-glycerol-3-phosphate acyltransferase